MLLLLTYCSDTIVTFALAVVHDVAVDDGLHSIWIVIDVTEFMLLSTRLFSIAVIPVTTLHIPVWEVPILNVPQAIIILS
jgi:hypothetical protein